MKIKQNQPNNAHILEKLRLKQTNPGNAEVTLKCPWCDWDIHVKAGQEFIECDRCHRYGQNVGNRKLTPVIKDTVAAAKLQKSKVREVSATPPSILESPGELGQINTDIEQSGGDKSGRNFWRVAAIILLLLLLTGAISGAIYFFQQPQSPNIPPEDAASRATIEEIGKRIKSLAE